MVGVPLRFTWTTVPSWRLVPRPTRMTCTSPRITDENQTLDSSPSSTSPITSAGSAIQAARCPLCTTPPEVWIIYLPSPLILSPYPLPRGEREKRFGGNGFRDKHIPLPRRG